MSFDVPAVDSAQRLFSLVQPSTDEVGVSKNAPRDKSAEHYDELLECNWENEGGAP